MSCSGCSYKPLNGLPLGGNTEGGRLHKATVACAKKYVNNNASSPFCCNPYKTTIQPTITPASGNYTSDLALGLCSVGGLASKPGVTAERVQQLIAAATSNNFRSETARIMSLQQMTVACNPASPVPIPIIIEICPPLPPVPGPPYVCKPSRLTR